MIRVTMKQKHDGYYPDEVSLLFSDMFQACGFVERALPHMEGGKIEVENVEEKKEGDAENTAHNTHEQEDENDLPVL